MSEQSTRERLDRNNRYYERFISQVNQRSENRDFSRAFESFLPKVISTGPVLDVGCGTGNHIAEFMRRGHRAIGIEPSAAMRAYSEQKGVDVVDGSFETLDSLSLPRVGGIWCAASLLHVPQEEIASVFASLGRVALPSAPLYFTIRLGQGSKWDKWDDEESDAARFIQLFDQDTLMTEVSRSPFEVLESWVEESTWGRPSQWLSVIGVRR